MKQGQRAAREKRELVNMAVERSVHERFKRAVQFRGMKLQAAAEQAIDLWMGQNGKANGKAA